MPFPRSWLPRIAAIQSSIEGSCMPAFDRDAVSQLFALKRRAALSLMKEAGPIRLRNGRWVVSREKLIFLLEAQVKEAEIELARKERFTEALIAADASLPRRPSIILAPQRVAAELREAWAVGLPEGVTLELGPPHRLVVEFTTIEEVTERMIGTGFALNNRFSFYENLIEPPDPVKAAEEQAEREDAEYFRTWRPD